MASRVTDLYVLVGESVDSECIKGQWGVPLTVYPWYLLCSLGILGDNLPINTHYECMTENAGFLVALVSLFLQDFRWPWRWGHVWG